MQLTRRRTATGPVGDAVDHHTAASANPLSTVVIEGKGLVIRGDETFHQRHEPDAPKVFLVVSFLDGNLITSRTPDDLPAFLRTIIAACEESPEAAMVAERAHHAG